MNLLQAHLWQEGDEQCLWALRARLSACFRGLDSWNLRPGRSTCSALDVPTETPGEGRAAWRVCPAQEQYTTEFLIEKVNSSRGKATLTGHCIPQSLEVVDVRFGKPSLKIKHHSGLDSESFWGSPLVSSHVRK